MTIRNLDVTLRPGSVALYGASERADSVGAVVMRNILAGDFNGPVWPVNPKYSEVMGLNCYAGTAELPESPDLAVIATPAASVPGLISELGARGCKAAVVVSAGLTDENGLRQQMLDAACPHLLRVIGPNTIGLIAPRVRLNASFAHMAPKPGKLALLSQSGAMATTMIDWAAERGIGFSQIVSLGDQADVDVGDCLDLLAGDGGTRAILMYLESIPQARKFLSAARAASRLKPVIAVKAGRSAGAAKAAATHTGVLSGADDVVEAALRRSGILRVEGLQELFRAAETVARFKPIDRARLGIVTNGGGAGVMAVDRLEADAGELALLSQATIAALDASLPGNWSGANPVDIVGDAPPERYLAALDATAADENVDVMLVMNCPTGLAAPADAAQAVAGRARNGLLNGKPLLTCWLGGVTARPARTILHDAGVAHYDSPSAASAAVGHLTNWSRAQAALLRVPDREMETALRKTPRDARDRVAELFARVAAEGRTMLTEPESKAALAAYGVPVPETRVARNPVEAGDIASDLLRDNTMLAVKLMSREITHKSDLGGVVLDIGSPSEAEDAALAIERRVLKALPDAEIDGFSVQPMIRRSHAQELILGVSHDPVFGPFLLFGAGGVAVELLGDTAVALPPLDATLAADLVSQTRIGRLLEGYRGRPAAHAPAIYGALIALSHMIEDFPCLRGLDVNPLIADAEGVMALDARIEIDPADLDRKAPNPDLAIRPYPTAWRRAVELKDGGYVLRPIRPGDVALYAKFYEHLDPTDIRMRFLAPRSNFSDEMVLRLTQLDYDRDMAFVALTPKGDLAGVARVSCDPDHQWGEYALIVRSDLKGRGIGTALMDLLIEYARADGLEHLEGMILTENQGMRSLVERLGFVIRRDPDESSIVQSRLDLARELAH